MGLEPDHSPPSSIEIKNVWSYTTNLCIGQHFYDMLLRNRDVNFV
jgi:hypothetical protein